VVSTHSFHVSVDEYFWESSKSNENEFTQELTITPASEPYSPDDLYEIGFISDK
jgi:hypothetical protein